MARTFYCTANTRTGVTPTGANFTRALSETGGTPAAQSVTITGTQTETDYYYSASGYPGETTWPTTTWTVRLDISTGVNKVYATCWLARVSSDGSTVRNENASSEGQQEIEIPGPFTWTFSTPSWGSGGTDTDLIRVRIAWFNDNHGDMGIAYDTYDSYVSAPFTAETTETKTLSGGGLRVKLSDGTKTPTGGMRVRTAPSIVPTGGVRVRFEPTNVPTGGARVRLGDGQHVLVGGCAVSIQTTETITLSGGGARVRIEPTLMPTGGVRVETAPTLAPTGGLRVRLADGDHVLSGGARIGLEGTHAPTGGVRAMTTPSKTLVGGLALESGETTEQIILGGGARVRLADGTAMPTGGVRVQLTGTHAPTGGARLYLTGTVGLVGGLAIAGGETTETITLSGGGVRVRLTDGTDVLSGGSRVRVSDGQHVLGGGLRVETAPSLTPVGGVRLRIGDGQAVLVGGSRVRIADGGATLAGGAILLVSPTIVLSGGVALGGLSYSPLVVEISSRVQRYPTVPSRFED